MSVIESKVFESAKLLNLPEEVKLEVFLKLGILASAVLGDSDIGIIEENRDVYEILTAENVLDWVLLEKNGETFNRAVDTSRNLKDMFMSSQSVGKVVKSAQLDSADFSGVDDIQEALNSFSGNSVEGLFDESADDAGYDAMAQFSDGEDFDSIAEPEKEKVVQGLKVDGYIPEIHNEYRAGIERIILTSYKELYGGFFNGQESIDGFVIPGGTLAGENAVTDSKGNIVKVQGILKVNKKKIEIEPNTISNALYEEFYRACIDCGVSMVKEVETERGNITPYKYNPIMHMGIANGSMAGNKPFNGWDEYTEFIKPKIEETTKELAVIQAEEGSLEPIYEALSGYTMTLMVVNYKRGLGSQIKINCGDNSKTAMVASKFAHNLREREKTHRALAAGNLKVSNPLMSPEGTCAVIGMFQNIKGYQSVPTFMGELLYNMPEGQFRPSINNMIIGKSIDNKIVTAPLTKWLLPVIAGSRSGKGVLTLNMLLNVIGTGTPLIYLDGKPDMAALLWDMMKRHGISKGVVVDGVAYEGVTDIDGKNYTAPYMHSIIKSMQREDNNEILENNASAMIYLKTMFAINLGFRYHKSKMGSKYGDIFVVFDEMYVVFIQKVNQIFGEIEMAKKDKTKSADCTAITNWIENLMKDFQGGDAGTFAAGIKAVALTQHSNADMYVGNSTEVKKFCLNFLLRRATKLYGRQESGGTGTYAVSRDKNDELNFDLYNNYYHFGIGTTGNNTYNNLKTFKPLLVLNENDCMELTGKSADGAFMGGVIERIKTYVDVPEFRKNNFENKEFARTIGFEGALEQIGRLTGNDWREQFKLSLGRGYEILEEALRYHGLIGKDGVEDFYDFITDFRISGLANIGSLTKQELAGRGLDGEGTGSMFELSDSETEDEKIDFNISAGNEVEQENTYIEEDKQVHLGSESKLTREEEEFMRRRAQKTQEYSREEAPVIEEQPIMSNVVPLKKEINTRPEEVYYGETPRSFETKGNVTYLNNSVPEENKVDFNSENYMNVGIESNHPIHRIGKSLYKTFQGTQYEFRKRFKLILDSISSKIQPNMVTRIIIAEDEITVNGRFIDISSLIGGYANIRLFDIISYKELFKRFKNVKELTLDTTMYEALYIEKPNMPNGVFELSRSLSMVSIIDTSGRKEIIKRGDVNKSNALDGVSRNNEFEAICASKNPRLSEKSPGYSLKIGESAKSFSKDTYKKSWEKITQEKPSFVGGLFFAGAATIGAGVSLAGYGVGSLFKLFKR